jgi:hypothetical protein
VLGTGPAALSLALAVSVPVFCFGAWLQRDRLSLTALKKENR